MPEGLDACWRAIHNAAFDVDDAPLSVALHALCDADVAPRVPPGTPVGSCPDWIATGLAPRANVGAQAIGTQQQRAMEGTGAYPLDQTPNQRHVTLLTDFASHKRVLTIIASAIHRMLKRRKPSHVYPPFCYRTVT
jgi:hypothetical protein